MNENGPSVYLGYRTKGWRQSVFRPIQKGCGEGMLRTDATSQRRRGMDTSNLLLSPYVRIYPRASPPTPLRRGTAPSTHTQHVAIPEPTTAVKYSRATNYREHSHSRVEPRRVRRRTIYCRASAETESFMLAGRREVIEYAGSRVLARRWQFL